MVRSLEQIVAAWSPSYSMMRPQCSSKWTYLSKTWLMLTSEFASGFSSLVPRIYFTFDDCSLPLIWFYKVIISFNLLHVSLVLCVKYLFMTTPEYVFSPSTGYSPMPTGRSIEEFSLPSQLFLVKYHVHGYPWPCFQSINRAFFNTNWPIHRGISLLSRLFPALLLHVSLVLLVKYLSMTTPEGVISPSSGPSSTRKGRYIKEFSLSSRLFPAKMK